MSGLSFLKKFPGSLDDELGRVRRIAAPNDRLKAIQSLATHHLDFTQSMALGRVLDRTLNELGTLEGRPTLRLAWLAGHTVDHLVPATHVAALRRGLIVRSWVAPFGMVRQTLLDGDPALAEFAPDVVLLAPGSFAPRVTLSSTLAEVDAAIATHVAEVRALWAAARSRYGAQPIQEISTTATALFGGYDAHVPGAPVAATERLNAALIDAAREDRVLVLDTREGVRRLGRDVWRDPVRWLQAKQEVSPAAAPLYGDLLSRILAAIRGLSKKCVVLDLDNTLWGGVIGDDGLHGIVLGTGSAAGEAFVAFQQYLLALKERGVLLAVCSKNDVANAKAAFDSHPEMRIKYADITVFVANWKDKATNIREIAERMNIGLDALVFFDDNPAERALVGSELPMVAVPEVPTEPALYVDTLADAGYFEAVSFTEDDRQRQGQYAANAHREDALSSATDMEAFLRDLSQVMTFAPFDEANLPRIVQLINKTNQFNLTTRRYTEDDVRRMIRSADHRGYWVRLRDKFGDNGLISVVITRADADVQVVDTWLMSCRVLGRGVEQAILEQLAQRARQQDAQALIGEYIPTAKNAMVAELYPRLGFTAVPSSTPAAWRLDLSTFRPVPHHIALETSP